MSVQPAPEVPLVDQDDELCHQICCRDKDIALCGRDVSQATWRKVTKPATECVVCTDLDQEMVCPLFGHCVPLTAS